MLMKTFQDWEISDTWSVLAMVLIIAAAILGGIAIFAPKNVDYYYLSTTHSGNAGLGFCVYAHWTWHNDEIAYCTDDKDKALDFAAKANATIHK
jgi:hypothetical protein